RLPAARAAPAESKRMRAVDPVASTLDRFLRARPPGGWAACGFLAPRDTPPESGPTSFTSTGRANPRHQLLRAYKSAARKSDVFVGTDRCGEDTAAAPKLIAGNSDRAPPTRFTEPKSAALRYLIDHRLHQAGCGVLGGTDGFISKLLQRSLVEKPIFPRR